MKIVYTNEFLAIVDNAKNILEANDIETIVKNEFLQGAVGEVPAIDTWPELWVLDESKYDSAVKIIEEAFNSEEGEEWLCSKCNETNASSFGSCWQCQNPAPEKS